MGSSVSFPFSSTALSERALPLSTFLSSAYQNGVQEGRVPLLPGDMLVLALHDLVEPLVAGDAVVVQELDAVEAPHGNEAVLLPLVVS